MIIQKMRILVISDTHIPSQAKVIPALIKEEARKSDYCLHCGDFTAFSVFKKISEWTQTFGVCGNMDDAEVRKALPLKQILKFEDTTIALTHGGGHPQNLIRHVNQEFDADMAKIDIFIFGHSHNALNTQIEGKIYFNPGSVTDNVFAATRSYGILNIKGKEIERTILTIK